jgi:hypothetical protein
VSGWQSVQESAKAEGERRRRALENLALAFRSAAEALAALCPSCARALVESGTPCSAHRLPAGFTFRSDV